MLYLVGVTRGFEKRDAHYQCNVKRSLTRLAQGVYCEVSDLVDLPAFMRKNALRIANYLFPKSALTHSSAYFSGAVESKSSTAGRPHFVLFLGSTYSHATRLQHLDIVQAPTMMNRLLYQYCDSMIDGQESDLGPLRIQRSNEELIFLQNFNRRASDDTYSVDRFLKDSQLEELRDKLHKRHGSMLRPILKRVDSQALSVSMPTARKDGANAHMALLTQRERTSQELRRALIYLDTKVEKQAESTNSVYSFTVGWFGRPIATLSMNGVTWDLTYSNDWHLPLATHPVMPGVMPAFVQNMFPEGQQLGAIQQHLRSANAGGTVFSRSERYMANIAIVESPERLKAVPRDVLSGTLELHCTNMAVYQGRLEDMPKFHPQGSAEFDALTAESTTPRISGNQAKLPCYLDERGVLAPSVDKPFTHFLKLPGLSRDQRNARGAMEWAGMIMARGAGLETCNFALVDLENGTLGCLIERYDIPRGADDLRMVFAEDFCSIAGMPPQSKMMSENGLLDVIDMYRTVCSPSAEDQSQLLRLIYVNHLVENGDFHLKNVGVVRTADPTLMSFRSTRLAPAFDIMNTRYFSDFGMQNERRESMVLEFKGRANFSVPDLVEMGIRIGLGKSEAEQVLKDTAEALASTAQALADRLPTLFEFHPVIKAQVLDSVARAAFFCRQDFPHIEPFFHADVSIEEKTGFPKLALSPAAPSRQRSAELLGDLMPFDPRALLDSMEGQAAPELLVQLRARL